MNRPVNDIAVVHDTAFEYGGGVRVAEELCRTLDAPLYFGIVDEEVINQIDDTIRAAGLFDTLHWGFRRAMRNGPGRHALYIWAFQHVPELHEYNVVVQSGSGADWYVPVDGQRLVRYVHSPAACYYRAAETEASPISRVLGIVSRTLRTPTVGYPDAYLVNSELTARRVRQYLSVEPDGVAYPPIDADSFGSSAIDIDPDNGPASGAFLVLGRLTGEKGIVDAVRTFTTGLSSERLIVAGDGPARDEIERAAGGNVDVRGYVSEAEKRALLASAEAFIVNSGNESFGIVGAEALASGTPILARAGGYTPCQVTHGYTGLVYGTARDHPNTLADAVRSFVNNGVTATASDIAQAGEQYDVSRFRDVIRDVISQSNKDTPAGTQREIDD